MLKTNKKKKKKMAQAQAAPAPEPYLPKHVREQQAMVGKAPVLVCVLSFFEAVCSKVSHIRAFDAHRSGGDMVVGPMLVCVVLLRLGLFRK